VAQAILPVRFFEALLMRSTAKIHRAKTARWRRGWLCHLQEKNDFYGGKLKDLSLVSTQTLTTFVF
jgi:hypothetical protein